MSVCHRFYTIYQNYNSFFFWIMHVLEYLFRLIKKLVLIRRLLDVSLIRYALCREGILMIRNYMIGEMKLIDLQDVSISVKSDSDSRV